MNEKGDELSLMDMLSYVCVIALFMKEAKNLVLSLKFNIITWFSVDALCAHFRSSRKGGLHRKFS